MAKIAYQPKLRFGADAREMIERADVILASYAADGYTMTLRQLYYRFVAGGHLANSDANYDKLGDVISRGRLAGLIDWGHLTDRTRRTNRINMWERPSDVINAAAAQYRIDPWKSQDYHVEVWVEKEALAEVIGRPANRLRVTHFCCRGYTSQSSTWEAAQRLVQWDRAGKRTLIIHLGDHDPSGIDMSRDITDRVSDFMVHHGADRPEVRRIALNLDQVRQYDPPPNPAKLTDSRAHGPNGYIANYGSQSWELDALEPRVLDTLIEEHIQSVIDQDAWDEALAREEDERENLVAIARRWPSVVRFVKGSA